MKNSAQQSTNSGDKHLPPAAKTFVGEPLTRQQRDCLRWRARYLMQNEKYLQHLQKERHMFWAAGAELMLKQDLIVVVQRLLADFRDNKSRAQDSLVQQYWEQQLALLVDEVEVAEVIEKPVIKQLDEAVVSGLHSSKVVVETLDSYLSVMQQAANIHTAAMQNMASSASSLAERIKLPGKGINVALQAVVLASDIVALGIDRVQNREKTFVAKLLQGGRWRRMTKALMWIGIGIVGLIVPAVLPLLVIAGIAATGVIEVGHQVYERRKQRDLRLQLGKELHAADMALNQALREEVGDLSEKGWSDDVHLRGEKIAKIAALDPEKRPAGWDRVLKVYQRYRLQKALYLRAQHEHVNAKKKLGKAVAMTLSGLLGPVLIVASVLFPPLAIVGAVVAAVVGAVEAYQHRNVIKGFFQKVGGLFKKLGRKIKSCVVKKSVQADDLDQSKELDQVKQAKEIVDSASEKNVVVEKVLVIEQVAAANVLHPVLNNAQEDEDGDGDTGGDDDRDGDGSEHVIVADNYDHEAEIESLIEQAAADAVQEMVVKDQRHADSLFSGMEHVMANHEKSDHHGGSYRDHHPAAEASDIDAENNVSCEETKPVMQSMERGDEDDEDDEDERDGDGDGAAEAEEISRISLSY